MNEPAVDRTGTVTVAQRMDTLPVTRLHLAVFALATLGLFVDIGEVAISNVLGAVFLAPPHKVAQGELSLLLASVFAGGAIGAVALGWLGDHHGRRLALQIALAVIAVSSVCAALSPDVRWMTSFRFVSGLAIGGYPPLTAAYLADLVPPLRRGMFGMICAALGFLGAPAMIFLIRGLAAAPLGLEGWRWGLLAGGAVAALAAALFTLVPESPRWLASVGREREADETCRRFERASGEAGAAPVTAPQPKPDTRDAAAVVANWQRRAVYLAALHMLAPWATIGFPVLSAAVLVAKGFAVSDSLLFAGLATVGPTMGALIASTFIDRAERRAALVACAACMIAAGIVFAESATFTPLVLAGIVFSLVGAVYGAALAIYGAELFPTALRARTTGTAWALGRVASAFVPIVLLPLLTGYGALAMFAAIAAALLASIVLIAAVGPPGLARKPLT